jgi:hypothetical protein
MLDELPTATTRARSCAPRVDRLWPSAGPATPGGQTHSGLGLSRSQAGQLSTQLAVTVRHRMQGQTRRLGLTLLVTL